MPHWTRDIDLAAHGLENHAEHVLVLIREIAAIAIAIGLIFDAEHATAEAIREDDHYSGVRVTLGGELSRASIRLHVDINVGDPIWPEPQQVRLDRRWGRRCTHRATWTYRALTWTLRSPVMPSRKPISTKTARHRGSAQFQSDAEKRGGRHQRSGNPLKPPHCRLSAGTLRGACGIHRDAEAQHM